MNYNETVEKVMILLKEKEVCSSGQKSHRDCCESLDYPLSQRDDDVKVTCRHRLHCTALAA